MNIYFYKFTAKCPNNNLVIHYELTIYSKKTIMVEEIISLCSKESTYHEDLADILYDSLGGYQIINAYHHGVWIKTIRSNEMVSL